ncbi:MAG: DUF2461 domain-containing protein [Chloroflexi bacterium]|nr:DUF2461 domain-containing protein [Chloroflexota bacterium]
MTQRAPGTPFTGFPAEGLQFMRDLAANNTREWFESRKQAYLDTVQGPAVALVEALGARLQDLVPGITVDTRTNGSGNLMRLHRDTRFSTDKSPYKTHIPMMFPVGGKKMDSPGFGLQITLDGVDCMAGVFRVRQRRVGPLSRCGRVRHARPGAREGGRYRAQGRAYTLNGGSFKRVPSGYDPEHPRAEWLRYGGLYASISGLPQDIARSAALVDVLMTHFAAMKPIVDWLRAAIG